MRLNDATGTGALNSVSSATQPEARVSFTATWFDGINRTIASANYGAAASFSPPTTPPASSSTLLVTSVTYDNAGRVFQTTDPMGNVTQTAYDNAGRTIQVLEVFTSANQRETDTAYTVGGRIYTLTAVNGTTGNQVTTYAYGTTLTYSGVARNDLLASVTYPDSGVVSYTYNRLGQPLTITDQRGTVRTMFYDLLGRLTDNAVTTVGLFHVANGRARRGKT